MPTWADGTTPALSAANLALLANADLSNVSGTPNLPAGTQVNSKAVVVTDSGGHILTSGTAPTAASGSGGGTISVLSGSTDQHGSIQLNNAAISGNTLCTVTFHTAMPNATYTVLASLLPNSGALGTVLFTTSQGTGSFVLNFPVVYSPPTSTFTITYIIMC